MAEFACNSIQFELRNDETPEPDRNQPPSAFESMMNREKEKVLPKNSDPATTEPVRIFNDVLKLLSENKVGWSPSLVDTVGKSFVQLLANTLWHITTHFAFFKERGASLDGTWDRFADRNNWRDQSNPKPQLCAKKAECLHNTVIRFIELSLDEFKNFFPISYSCVLSQSRVVEDAWLYGWLIRERREKTETE